VPAKGRRASGGELQRRVLGVPGGRVRRRDGAAGAGVQAHIPRRVHRHVAALARDVPDVPVRGLAAGQSSGNNERCG